MYDDELMIMMFTIIGLGIIVLRQFFVTRRLKKRVSALELGVNPPAAKPVGLTDSSATSERDTEVNELRKRVQVLERITVEKENSLSKQIEELRDR